MAKKPAPLQNRLARYATDRRSGVVAAALQPSDGDRPLPEVTWDVLSRLVPLAVADAAELAECLDRQPTFRTAQATGWVAGILGTNLAFPRISDPLADPKLRAIENEVLEALGPEALWHTNGGHPIPSLRPDPNMRGWTPIIDATFDLVIAARGNGFDLVLARADED